MDDVAEPVVTGHEAQRRSESDGLLSLGRDRNRPGIHESRARGPGIVSVDAEPNRTAGLGSDDRHGQV
ncbi:hypothetical protein ACFPRL_32070 [Pseudoclavibacter helvolus]